jgi:hypothetical protein
VLETSQQSMHKMKIAQKTASIANQISAFPRISLSAKNMESPPIVAVQIITAASAV